VKTWWFLRASWRLDAKAAAAFRWDSIIGVGVSLVWLGFAIAPVLAAGRFLGEGDGWTEARLLFLQAVWYWMDAIMWVVCVPNAEAFRQEIRQGRLDAKFLWPANSLAVVMLGRVGVADLHKFFIALGLGAWAVAAGAFPGSVWSVAGFIVCLLAASVIFWALGVFTVYKAMTLFKFDGSVALTAAHNLARVPVGMYGPVLRLLLSSVFPVILITTVPSTVFFGWSSWQLPLASATVAVAAVIVLKSAWRRETRLYVGLQN
jgi:ABC-2 type transport system permease protein